MPRSKYKSKSKESSSEVEHTDVDDDEEENEEVYNVEVITGARVAEHGDGEVDWEYFVKWANYPSSASSWEPAANVQGCKGLLQEFWAHIGTDDKDYEVGFEVHAKKQWINKKKYVFKRASQSESSSRAKNEKKGRSYSRDDRKKVQPGEPVKGIAKSTTITVDTSDDDDMPLAKAVTQLKPEPQIRSTAQKRAHDSGDETSLPKAKSRKIHAESDVKNDPSASKRTDVKSPRDQSPIHDLFSDRSSSPEVSLGSQQRYIDTAQSTSLQINSIPRTTQPAQSTASVTTRPIAKGIPAHRQRQNNPQVKLLDLSPEKINKGSSLSTKNRVVQTPVVPSPLLTFPGRNSLTHLSFKKIPKPAATPVDKKPSPTPQLGNHEPETIADDLLLLEPASAPPSPTEDISDSIAVPHVHTSQDDQVENFLFSVMPDELSAPLKPSYEEENRTDVLPKVKPVVMNRIPKKWKWSGELFISMAADNAKRLCDVTIQDTTEHKAEGLRLSFFFQKRDSVRLKKLHDITDLNIILPSFGPVHQFARLVPREGTKGLEGNKNKDALSTLSSYMTSGRKFTYSPLLYVNEVTVETEVAAFLFVFPPFGEVCSQFNVPDDLMQGGGDGMVVALLSPQLKPVRYRELRWSKSTWPVSSMVKEDSISLPNRFLKSDPAYARALRILDFPRWLHDFIPGRSYCIWFAPADGAQEESGMKIKGNLQTQALVTILDRTQAKNVGYKSNLRVVFVHVGALKTLHRLPAFCERKLRCPELQFITYGKHPTVPEHRWGIRELYTVGGIVTFTPNAILSDPHGVLKLIRKIHDHPLWECFILPSVVGLTVELAQQMDDAYACDLISDLWSAIEDGEIALIEAPPIDPHPWMNLSQDLGWVRRQQSFPRESTTLLVNWYNKEYAGPSQADRQSSIVEDISQNMLAMSLQPAFMDSYRRFVVITHASDEKVKVDTANPTKAEPVLDEWLEWHVLASFSFKDNFFNY